MANKGLWCLVQYPDTTDINTFLDVLRGSGASVFWILHNKDFKEKDVPDKDHVHICAGWSKGFPEFKTVLEMIDSAPAADLRPDQHPYHPPVKKCYPKGTPEEIETYFLHWDAESRANPLKHVYGAEELHKDEGFDGSAYVKAEERRKKESDKKAAEKSGAFADAMKIIRESGFVEWYELVDWYLDNGLDLEGLTANAFPIKAYLDSMRNCTNKSSVKIQRLEGEIDGLKQQLAKYKAGERPVVNALRASLEASEDENNKLDRSITRLAYRCADLYARYTGERVSATEIMADVLDNGNVRLSLDEIEQKYFK